MFPPWLALLRLSCSENREDIPQRIRLALDKKKQLHAAFKHRREHFGFSVGLVPKAKGSKLVGVPTIYLTQQKEPYPPNGHNIYESAAVREIWENHYATAHHPDPRGGRTWKPLLELDSGKLQYVVGVGESVIIRDEKTEEIIGMVIRNFSNQNLLLLDWINGIIKENTGLHRNVRASYISKLCLWCCAHLF